MPRLSSRRDVLKAAASTTVGLALGGRAYATTPFDLVRYGVIGISGRGANNLDSAHQNGTVVALCDVDAGFRAKAMTDYPMAATFSDYRRMIDDMHKYVDAVTVSTPDHNHAAASALALRAGKAVYCEKPLTHSIHEARVLRDLARRAGVASQMGNQGTAEDALRKCVQLVKTGVFGAPKEVWCWTDRPAGWWPQGAPRPPRKPIPAGLNWDCWIGPAPFRDYGDGYHTFAWRGRWDFGTGSLGDMGCHVMNLPVQALDLFDPIAVQSETSGNNKECYPLWSKTTWEFGQRGKRGPVKMHWLDGGNKPDKALVGGKELESNGSIMVFEKGTIYSASAYGGAFEVINGPSSLPDVTWDHSPGHFKEFDDAIKGGKPAKSNFDNAVALVETVLLGNLAIWASGPRLEWDPRSMSVKGSKEFDSILKPTYREGWTL